MIPHRTDKLKGSEWLFPVNGLVPKGDIRSVYHAPLEGLGVRQKHWGCWCGAEDRSNQRLCRMRDVSKEERINYWRKKLALGQNFQPKPSAEEVRERRQKHNLKSGSK